MTVIRLCVIRNGMVIKNVNRGQYQKSITLPTGHFYMSRSLFSIVIRDAGTYC